jgi:hypothetical protein
MKSLKKPKGYADYVSRIRTDNTMAKRKRTNISSNPSDYPITDYNRTIVGITNTYIIGSNHY